MPDLARSEEDPLPAAAGLDAELDAAQCEVFLEALDQLAGAEEAFTNGLYASLFERCPESAPLFGEYSISEREEMVRETFRALLGWLEQAPWLEGNLHALGQSHAEYGVEAAMYPPFVEALVESASQVLDEPVRAASLPLIRRATEAITDSMRRAGDE